MLSADFKQTTAPIAAGGLGDKCMAEQPRGCSSAKSCQSLGDTGNGQEAAGATAMDGISQAVEPGQCSQNVSLIPMNASLITATVALAIGQHPYLQHTEQHQL